MTEHLHISPVSFLMGMHLLKTKTYIGTPCFKITVQWFGPLQKNFLPFFKKWGKQEKGEEVIVKVDRQSE